MIPAVLLAASAACGGEASAPASVPATAAVRVEVDGVLAAARAQVRGLVERPQPDPRFLPLARLLERVHAGTPVLQRVGRTPGCWSIPLVDGTTAVAELFARLDGRAVIEWPHRVAVREDRSNLIPQGTFSILDAFPDATVPTLAFFPPPPEAVMPPVMFDAIELGRLVKLVGLPLLSGETVAGRLPHVTVRSYAKCLKESPVWVARVNARPRPVKWKSVTGPRSVSAKCWSYAFSYAVDWWNEELGRSPGRYRSFLTGELERGADPRTLELLYQREATLEPDRFVNVPAAFLEDPVTGEPIVSNMDAFASLLVRPGVFTVDEPLIPDLIGKTRTVDAKKLPMGTTYRRLFHLNSGDHRAVADALHRHGLVIAGEVHRYRGCPLFYSTHAVPIVGHVAIGGAPYLVYLDAQMSGARGIEDRLRAYPVSMFSEAYCFPHELTLRAQVRRRTDGVTISVELQNQAGRTLTGADRVELRGAGQTRAFHPRGRAYELTLPAAELSGWGDRAVVHAEQPYYYGASDGGADLSISLEGPATRFVSKR